MQDFLDKAFGVLNSRRFWAAVMGVLMVIFVDVLGLSQEQAETITFLIMSWIVGDSVMKTGRIGFMRKHVDPEDH